MSAKVFRDATIAAQWTHRLSSLRRLCARMTCHVLFMADASNKSLSLSSKTLVDCGPHFLAPEIMEVIFATDRRVPHIEDDPVLPSVRHKRSDLPSIANLRIGIGFQSKVYNKKLSGFWRGAKYRDV